LPEAGPLLAAVFLLVGVVWLTAQRSTEPVPATDTPGERRRAALPLGSAARRVLRTVSSRR
ncbi:hypothetical protein ACWC5G_36020, partial [Streptomyces sp. NPDC001274]